VIVKASTQQVAWKLMELENLLLVTLLIFEFIFLSSLSSLSWNLLSNPTVAGKHLFSLTCGLAG
jgi:hypothetical protein